MNKIMIEDKYVDDRKHSLLLFGIVWFIYSIIYLSKLCFSSAMAQIVSEGAFTKTQTGTVSAVFYIIYGIFQFVGGFATDKYRPERLITIGFVGAAISNLIIYFVHNYIVMLIVWGFNGIIQFGVWPSVYKIISTQLNPKHRYYGSFYIGTSSLAGIVFSYLVVSFISRWQNNFLVSFILMLLCTILWLFSYPRIEKKMIKQTVIKQVEEKVNNNNSDVFRLIVVSGLILLLPVCLLHTTLINGLKNFIPIMVMESYQNLSPQFVSRINIFLSLFSIVGIFVLELLYPKKVKNEVLMFIILYVPALLFALALLNVGKVNVYLLYTSVLFSLVFLSASSQFPAAFFARRFIEYGCVGTISGIINGICSFGLVVTNFGIAYLADNFGWNITIKIIILSYILVIVFCGLALPSWKKFIYKQK